ncbi:MAG: hypothetical protein AAF591_21110 [Verrucomicrobiota bacterium]
MTSTRNRAARVVVAGILASFAFGLAACQNNHFPYSFHHRTLHSHGHIPIGAAQHGWTGTGHFWKKSKPVKPPMVQAAPDSVGGGRAVDYGK